ncbi:MAG: oligopeptide transport system substrate-binding protein [Symbiobacteriaceae bacterium]|jgi:oligopeptide transport system substrate-binding protein|nr:oligopeptide transport system substrate-binding protein [Symbiobacteriaceae bacterium]
MRRFIAGFLAVSMLAAVGCSKNTDNKEQTTDKGKDPAPSQPAAAQVIRINIGTDPETLDPAVSTGVPESNVQLSLYEGLMRLDKDGKPVAGMAETHTVSPDGKTYTFKLRDAKWSNGDAVTANDFVYAWKRALDPMLASEYAYQLYYLEGAEAANTIPLNQLEADGKTEKKGADGKPIARPEADIKKDWEAAAAKIGVKAVDAKTLEVKLTSATPYFLSLTAFHTLYPVHQKSVEAGKADWFRKPETLVGNGPFKLVSWTPKDKVIVEKNPNYWDAKAVKLDKVEYYLIDSEATATQMFEAGQLDIIESGVNNAELPRLKKEYPDELKILPDLGLYYYRFNVTKAPMNDVKVRKALTLAIDRQLIVETITQGGQLPAMSEVPGGMPDVSGDFRANGKDFFKDNDIATAKDLLKQAGYPDGKGFPKFTIMYNTSEGHKRIAEAIQEMWKKNLGINVELENVEWQVYLSRQSELDYDISRAGWIGDYIDPMTFADMWVTKGGNNQTGWANAEYDKLIATAKNSADVAVRMKAMHDSEKLLMDEMPILPIYHYVRVRMVSKNVKNWSEPLTSGMNLREAYLQK